MWARAASLERVTHLVSEAYQVGRSDRHLREFGGISTLQRTECAERRHIIRGVDWLAALLIAALFGVAGVIGFAVRSQLEEQQRARESLAGERRKIYADLLDPYIRIFALAKDKGETAD